MWNPFIKRQELPDWFLEYKNQSFNQYDKMDFYDVPFIVIDSEMTGLTLSDSITSIGGVVLHQHSIKLTDTFQILLPVQKGNEASTIHGELRRKLTSSSKKELLIDFLKRLHNYPIVGYHIKMDIESIQKEFREIHPSIKIQNRIIDLYPLLKRAGIELKEWQLESVCKHFNIPVENRHTALGDAYLTALVFQKALNLLKKRGLSKVNELKNRFGLL